MLRVESDQNFTHFLLNFIKGPNTIVKWPMGRGHIVTEDSHSRTRTSEPGKKTLDHTVVSDAR
jgi:hypothetical protein